ncbi:uncharacterized protein UV8b_03029 [Ustilaginoidea virens]|uniref:Jacalin-type lectin domain-containing protein n=1 Tax=Ustilaginoidea virens TaxID=1159556 RepID=A0A8E5HP26_USTVR|nr:uncharacterized protein UV8b_03029 [Ustilaginoidea virens]QUC18788.1 hypothetical protein UV8b_03029 [Ustilaginoidea virens]
MAPTFLKELRRRSRASWRTDNSTDASSDGTASQGTSPSSGSVTPPSVGHHSDPALPLQIKAGKIMQPHQAQTSQSLRPTMSVGNSSRHSMFGMSGVGAHPAGGRNNVTLSQYAPRIHNISENSWVHQKILLVLGTIGEPGKHSIDGTVTVSRYDDNFPAISWPVCESHVKVLLYLQPGPNKFRLDFSSPKLANSCSSNPIHASYLTLHMIPPMNTPPLQLAIIVGCDSPEQFDAPPARVEKEGNGLQTAIRKFRMAAYLWQAFTAEQMWRNKLGRRSFRYEEEWGLGTANYRDRENGTMRSEARVHVIRSKKSAAQIRSLNETRESDKTAANQALFDLAADEIKAYFNPLPGQKNYVSALFLDAHWSSEEKVVAGHAAMGGSSGDLQLAIFGSHCLHSYPSSFEEVVPAFTDCTPTDASCVANENNEAGSSWEVANIGIGAHLHETGHLFGCPHQESGIMQRDYVVLNRSFVSREAYSTRMKSKGGVVQQSDECGWHRLDCLRFRAHPAFRLPSDAPLNADDSVQAFATENGVVLATAATGISFVEILAEGDDVCHSWLEYTTESGPVQRQLALNEQDLRARLPEAKRKGRMSISIKSHGGGHLSIDDFGGFTAKASMVKLGSGKLASRSQRVGASQTEDCETQEFIFTSASKQDRVMSQIIAYHGSVLNGLEFVYDDNTSQLLGKQGSKRECDSFEFDVRRGEYLSGLLVRAGSRIEGVQILTSLGRKSPTFGNAHGGTAHNIIPPRGYSICGISGSCGSWVTGLSVLIKR